MKADEKSNRPDIEHMAAHAGRMLTALLCATSLERCEDVGAYVSALEAIVFELIAKHVDRSIRGMARAVYTEGVAAGLSGVGQIGMREVLPNGNLDAQRMLSTIRRTGEEHGREIRQRIAR